ncbi:unnamed protein product [Rotaria sp. Silwood2]|nr:unnamed protein product [Rotaria sp. Silwood2]
MAKTIVQKVLDGDYEIEVAFMFSGWWGIKENSISITGSQLTAVLSKTTADGGGTNNTYIHRNQASSFIGRYVTNVRTLIYMENTNTNLSVLTSDLPARFAALFQQGKYEFFNCHLSNTVEFSLGMESAQEQRILAGNYSQVWNPSDLNPDRITRELNKMFTYNQTETESHNYSDKYYNYNSDWKLSTSVSTSASANACIYGKFGCVSGSTSVDVDVSQEHQEVGGIPPWPWLLCDGEAVSRVTYNRLFSVIGTSYGVGDGSTTFNLPDFRGRFPLGVDEASLVVKNATKLGARGGQVWHNLTLDQLPSHVHDKGTYSTLTAGDHLHTYNDPGHNHGGHTGSSAYSEGTMTFHTPRGGRGNDHGSHSHTISTDKTNISINIAGDHIHSIIGQSSAVGGGHVFSILNPYETVNYIIYSN